MLHQPAIVPLSPDTELASGARLLHGQYQIEAPLIAGGFGITYLARDSLDRQVVIKECFPGEICTRVDGQVRPRSPAQLRSYKAVLRSFLREAHLLARAEHANIVPVHQVFRENGTGYIAMDFVEGQDLLSLRDNHPERVTQEIMTACLLQALQALDALHAQGILHRDIAPDNLIWTPEARLMLIDFGAACAARRDEEGAAEDAMAVKDGYSPHELYERSVAARPASDLYALGATLVFLLTGESPPAGPARLAAVTRGDPDPLCAMLATVRHDPFWASVIRALSVLPGERFQSAAEWLEALEVLTGGAEQMPEPAVELPATATADATVSDMPATPARAPTSNRGGVEDGAEDGAEDGPAPVDEPRLASRIASLVAETNDTITGGLPRTLREAQIPDPEAKAKRIKRQFVDLFGQPIGDPQSWMAEQDRPAQPPPARGTDQTAPDVAASQTEEAPAPRGGLSRFFGKRSTARHTAPAS